MSWPPMDPETPKPQKNQLPWLIRRLKSYTDDEMSQFKFGRQVWYLVTRSLAVKFLETHTRYLKWRTRQLRRQMDRQIKKNDKLRAQLGLPLNAELPKADQVPDPWTDESRRLAMLRAYPALIPPKRLLRWRETKVAPPQPPPDRGPAA